MSAHQKKPQFIHGQPSMGLPFQKELVVDLFAGGGGASTGIARAYREPDVAVNHNPIALGAGVGCYLEKSMSEEAEIVFVDGLGKMLGRTEASIREGIRRGVPWLPKGFKMGIRHCWLKADVREFLRACRDGENKAPKVGRKRNAPPTLRGVA